MTTHIVLRSWVDPDKIDWRGLSGNTCPVAVALLAANLDKIYWVNLSCNTCPAAAALLAANLDKIDWRFLSTNSCPAAMALLEANPDKVNWACLSQNPAIFEEVYDYAAMRAAADVHREALARAALHPRRLARHLALGGAHQDF